jgi:hypothetical protein
MGRGLFFGRDSQPGVIRIELHSDRLFPADRITPTEPPE